MLKVIQRFGKHCSCHLQGEYIYIYWLGIFGNVRDSVSPNCWYVPTSPHDAASQPRRPTSTDNLFCRYGKVYDRDP
jgi:hypothetical protein